MAFSVNYKKRTRESFDSHSQPPCSSSRPKRTYDVFLSFRGEDTRNNFVGHLYKALDCYGIYTFKDDEKLKKGKTVAPELLKSIEESRFSIVILSENYATSGWCLDELVKIIQCMELYKQIVIPIFYNVDPSDVRKQTGSFERAFDQHKRTFHHDIEKVLQWRKALTAVGNISGEDSCNKDGSVLIEKIVREISDQLFAESPNSDGQLVGMSHHTERLKPLLGTDDSDDVVMIGFWGMGGIGKTAISRALYDRFSRHYEGGCYFANVKDVFKKHKLRSLREKLLSEILLDRNLNLNRLDGGLNVVKERLSHKKVFIVLDDVDDLEQLESFVGCHDWFGPGSRIIITTRDKHLLDTHGVDCIYEVSLLETVEAFKLFEQYAFKHDHPTKAYLELSNQFISYAKGLPLALKVLGNFLYKRDIRVWRDGLEKLQRFPNAEIQDVLRLSFDGLDDDQKNIFLDICCFFKGEDQDFVTDILESCGFFPHAGLSVLMDKSLITISRGKLWTHDLLQEMGREVVRRESTEPGERSRLWLAEDIYDVFEHNTGTKAVQGIFLDMSSNIEEVQLTREAFKKMYNLRLLKIYSFDFDRNHKENIKLVHLPEGLEVLSDKLRYLYWPGYPLKCLPCKFQPKNLVELHMPYSNLERPWEDKKNMMKLKILDLSYSLNLKNIGDLSLALNLERINLKGCKSLQEIHPSIQNFNKLISLNLRDCRNLTNLAGLPGNIKNISYAFTPIDELPQFSFQHSNQLVTLVLEGCKFLSKLPRCVSSLNSLEHLNLRGCKGKDSTGLLLPPLWGLHSLNELILGDCNLVKLPEGLVSLTSLEILDLSGNNFERLDVSLEPLTYLYKLILDDCKMLRSLWQLPPNMRFLHTRNCNSLEIVSSSKCRSDGMGLPSGALFAISATQLVFMNCFNLNPISLRSLTVVLFERLKFDAELAPRFLGPSQHDFCVAELCYPRSELPEWFTHQNVGSSLSFQLKPQMNTTLVGFMICAVVAFDGCCHDSSFMLNCNFYLEKIDGSVVTYSNRHSLGGNTIIFSDHLIIGYNTGFLAPGKDIYTNCHIEFVTCDSKIDLYCCKVKSCGAHPLYLTMSNGRLCNSLVTLVP